VTVKLGSCEGSFGDPVSKTLGWPGKDGIGSPDSKLIVKVKVAYPVPEAFVALIVTGKIPTPVGVPEISPGIGPRVKPPGRSIAS
jgi:hypothetical protein